MRDGRAGPQMGAPMARRVSLSQRQLWLPLVLLLLLLLLLLLSSAQWSRADAQQQMLQKQKQCLDGDWQFLLGIAAFTLAFPPS